MSDVWGVFDDKRFGDVPLAVFGFPDQAKVFADQFSDRYTIKRLAGSMVTWAKTEMFQRQYALLEDVRRRNEASLLDAKEYARIYAQVFGGPPKNADANDKLVMLCIKTRAEIKRLQRVTSIKVRRLRGLSMAQQREAEQGPA